MSTASICKATSLAVVVLALTACGDDSTGVPSSVAAALAVDQEQFSEWSAPVNLGPVINSPFLEESPMLSNDWLTLYFMSDRPGGVGGNDLWASHRACRDCAWEPPVNVVAVNSIRNENGPSLSRDGHLLFFQSNRAGSQLLDIYLASRGDPKDDQAWGPAVRLGPDVNTALRDIHPEYLPIGEDDAASLYFSRGATTHDADIFVVSMNRDGTTRGSASAVAELNDPNPAIDETSPTVRHDGREIFFRSDRVGSLGAGDLWASTRRSGDDSWSTPTNLGAVVNSAHDEVTPSLSFDGGTLFFVSDRPGGAGGYDIWMSTRRARGGSKTNHVLVQARVEEVDDHPHFSDWSAPVNLGPIVNSAVGDIEVSVSRNGLSLYIASFRSGSWDLWVSQRPSGGDPWGPPQNLGAVINTPFREQAPFLSLDGHRLYFYSDRPGGFGGTDLYVSRRRDKRDDFGWQPPENLGSGVNGSFNETLPVAFQDEAGGTVTLYFGSNRPGMGGTDIYASTFQPDETFGPAAGVVVLNSAARDAPFAIRRNGLEMFLTSDRPGTFGAFDLWVATRASTADAWSSPVSLGSVVNSAADDSRGALSFDGTTLYLESNRPGGSGDHDLWVSTRTRLKGQN